MRPGRPSVTARWVAAQRARLARTRPSTPGGQPEVELALDRDVGGLVTAPLWWRSRFDERTRFIDSEVARAIGHGVAQVVLLGAGYDGRALRFGGSGPRWFEVDHPETLADKRRRLASLGAGADGVTYVGADPTSDGVGHSLGAAGHDAGRPSLFVCEALFHSTTLEAAVNVCTALRDRASAGSTLAATFLVEPAVDRAEPVLPDVLGRLRQVVGTPRSDYSEGEPEKLLVVTGWRPVRSSSPPKRSSSSPKRSWSPSKRSWSPSKQGRRSHLHAVACEPSPVSAD
jgi:methyltransferase (TIGR00027 family)